MNTKPIMAKEKNGSRLLWRVEDEDHILLARHDIYVFNVFTREILELCNGEKDVDEIAHFVSEKYEIDYDQAIEEINKFLEFAESKKLIFWEA